MKKPSIAKFALSCCIMQITAAGVLAQATDSPTIVRPRVTVDFENEVQTLAKGFELAFAEMPSGGKYIEISTPKGPAYLEGSVRSVQAIEGVLLIQMKQGLVYVISARDILKLTNEKPAAMGD